MTESTDTQGVPASLQLRPGESLALIEIWKRPDIGFPSVFCRMVRALPRLWVPEVGDPLVHRSGARCTITGIREVSGGQHDEPPIYSVRWDTETDYDGQHLHAEFTADDFRQRFQPTKALPAIEWERGPWESLDASFAKRALRLKRYRLAEFPGVEWLAKRFESDRATQADYDRVIELRAQARAAKAR